MDSALAWQLSRATGFTAFVALALDVTLGLLMSTRAGARLIPRAQQVDLHRWLSPLTLALVAGHALLLLADDFIGFDLVDVLVPFAAPYRPFAVGIGVIAAYLALVIHLSFGLRKRLGTPLWRRLHGLSFVAFIAAAAHILLAGTDASSPWALAVITLPIDVIAGLVVYRLVRHGLAA